MRLKLQCVVRGRMELNIRLHAYAILYPMQSIVPEMRTLFYLGVRSCGRAQYDVHDVPACW